MRSSVLCFNNRPFLSLKEMLFMKRKNQFSVCLREICGAACAAFSSGPLESVARPKSCRDVPRMAARLSIARGVIKRKYDIKKKIKIIIVKNVHTLEF